MCYYCDCICKGYNMNAAGCSDWQVQALNWGSSSETCLWSDCWSDGMYCRSKSVKKMKLQLSKIWACGSWWTFLQCFSCCIELFKKDPHGSHMANASPVGQGGFEIKIGSRRSRCHFRGELRLGFDEWFPSWFSTFPRHASTWCACLLWHCLVSWIQIPLVFKLNVYCSTCESEGVYSRDTVEMFLTTLQARFLGTFWNSFCQALLRILENVRQYLRS